MSKCKFGINSNCHITWPMIMNDNSILSIQEPISEMSVNKTEFQDAYNDFVKTLDGRDMTSYVDFFWRRSPVNSGLLEFIDKDARLDIYDYLRDMDLIPDMNKVHSGDWKFNK